ncbi:Cap-specific mRNA (nucleoside-2'-O-)-methyltransferase 1 [Trichoplax sp. H2]|nr:Cap-specific mRNA (nucleoside-2'-O-)-methyltransferase 1 [Trichoplax sp. H2]|eukprot:RDD44641.1 Cap-specific mRNA (nucleoside-2'-O-)-methyltransferase 1 [Trichoplax sp. H2]
MEEQHQSKRARLEEDADTFDGIGVVVLIGDQYNEFQDTQPNYQEIPGNYSNVAKKLMAKMKYTPGEGLGRHSQGRRNIIEASKQRGHRGLGSENKHFQQDEDTEWSVDDEQINIEEMATWIDECQLPLPDRATLDSWMKIGKKKMTIDDEVNFCEPNILKDVLECKDMFDELESKEMVEARTRANPYETIKGAIFLNRAAMKMANLDYVYKYIFTNPRDDKGNEKIRSLDILYFADICAGPGGFTEYVLWKRRWHAKGFGITLKDPKNASDFKLTDFLAGTPETFEPYYGVNGVNGDGDVTRTENLRAFAEFVRSSSEGGVHFAMADGGFSVEGQENIQEILSKQLYLCQFLCAISVLREGGNFVCKLFDIFTPFSVGLLYLFYRIFRRISLVKPLTSRPANSERYIVCEGYRNADDVRDYFYSVNDKINELKLAERKEAVVFTTSYKRSEKTSGSEEDYFNTSENENSNQLSDNEIESDQQDEELGAELMTNALQDDRTIIQDKSSKHNLDVTEVVPLDVIRGDKAFYEYIVQSNNSIGVAQVYALRKIQAFAKNRITKRDLYYRNLVTQQQNDIKNGCLTLWNIPTNPRSKRNIPSPRDTFFKLLNTSLDDWETNNRIIEGKFIYRTSFDKYGNMDVNKWEELSNSENRINLEMPENTLIEAEIVTEYRGEGKSQKHVNAIHIVDIAFLGGDDYRNFHIKERLRYAEKFVKALQKKSINTATPLRVKLLHRLNDSSTILARLQSKKMKGSRGRKNCCIVGSDKSDDSCFFIPTGLYIVKDILDPWVVRISNTHNRYYFFNTANNSSQYDLPQEDIASFRQCHELRLFWPWDDSNDFVDSNTAKIKGNRDDKVSKDELLDFIKVTLSGGNR